METAKPPSPLGTETAWPYLRVQEAAAASWICEGICDPVCCLFARAAGVRFQPCGYQPGLQTGSSNSTGRRSGQNNPLQQHSVNYLEPLSTPNLPLKCCFACVCVTAGTSRRPHWMASLTTPVQRTQCCWRPPLLSVPAAAAGAVLPGEFPCARPGPCPGLLQTERSPLAPKTGGWR